MDGNCQPRGLRRDLGSKARSRWQKKKDKPKRLPTRLHKQSGTSNSAKLEVVAAYLNARGITRRESVSDELTGYLSKG